MPFLIPPPLPLPTLNQATRDQVNEIITTMKKKMVHDYKAGHTLRDAHPKSTGILRDCVFEVHHQADPDVRVGIFATPHKYKAVVRCSNANSVPSPDFVGDIRGFAIKLLDGSPQDFVLLSMNPMPLGTVSLFRDAIVLSIGYSPAAFLAKMLVTGNARKLVQLSGGQITPSSPLDIPYFSTTPYRYGDKRVCKYVIRPDHARPAPAASKTDPDYLTHAMQAQLKDQDMKFKFYVQFGYQGKHSIEDAAEYWDPIHSPEIHVATLTVPKQPSINVAGQELLRFSPKNAWPDHAALGPLNQARTIVYDVLADFRISRDAPSSKL
jgi:catalase